mmetsp:Transcript_104750/g.305852  ORF Transcript_104750/g.305852 Transcript_104750/m.305852 type:complete len:229 (-) Transcript_104750:234-920(-)
MNLGCSPDEVFLTERCESFGPSPHGSVRCLQKGPSWVESSERRTLSRVAPDSDICVRGGSTSSSSSVSSKSLDSDSSPAVTAPGVLDALVLKSERRERGERTEHELDLPEDQRRLWPRRPRAFELVTAAAAARTASNPLPSHTRCLGWASSTTQGSAECSLASGSSGCVPSRAPTTGAPRSETFSSSQRPATRSQTTPHTTALPKNFACSLREDCWHSSGWTLCLMSK